jgi:hypothetical protein
MYGIQQILRAKKAIKIVLIAKKILPLGLK